MTLVHACLFTTLLVVTLGQTFTQLGCYIDTPTRDLPHMTLFNPNSPRTCGNYCASLGFKFFGVQWANECFCGNAYGKYGKNEGCTSRCAGNSAEICGGFWHQNIYSINAVCGDGRIHSPENCDDGNTKSSDGCSASCTRESGWSCPTAGAACVSVCGDRIKTSVEACDDGNAIRNDGCSANCRSVEPGYTCPTVGASCIDINECSAYGCPGATCKESTPNSRICVCSPGYNATGSSSSQITLYGADVFAGCTDINECTTYGCVDKVSGQTETTCVDSTTGAIAVNQRRCTCPSLFYSVDAGKGASSVTLVGSGDFGGCEPICGDGWVVGVETCDDKNTDNNDGCSDLCKVEVGWNCTHDGTRSVCEPICGDGLLHGIEGCDDGNTISGDGCDSDCKIERLWMCLKPGSPCIKGDAVCGDKHIDSPETCDDNNTVPGDGCSASCILEDGWKCSTAGEPCVSICRDSLIVGKETCDDGNEKSGDGCSSECQLETGWKCPIAGLPCTPICGDGLKISSEECDDNNIHANDGCSPSCKVEPGWRCPVVAKPCEDIPECFDYGCPDPYLSNPHFEIEPAVCRESTITARLPVNKRECNCTPGTHVNTLPTSENSIILTGTAPFPGCIDINECLLYGCVDNLRFQKTECIESSTPGDTVVMLRDRLCRCPVGWHAVQAGPTLKSVTLTGNQLFEGCVGTCGDGSVVGLEACDDGNLLDGDGCNQNCTIVEEGWSCPPEGGPCTPICSDSIIKGWEICDDGNMIDGDGCNSTCQVEPGYVCPVPGVACCLALEEWMMAEYFVCQDGWWTSNATATTPNITFTSRTSVDIAQTLNVCGHLRITQPLRIWAGNLNVAGSVEITETGSLLFESYMNNIHGRLNIVGSCPLPIPNNNKDWQLQMREGSTFAIQSFNWPTYKDEHGKQINTWLDDVYVTAETCLSTGLGRLYVNASTIPEGTTNFNFATFSPSCPAPQNDLFLHTEYDLPGGCSQLYQNFTGTGNIHTGLKYQNLCGGQIAAIVLIGGGTSLLGLIALSVLGIRVFIGAATYFAGSSEETVEFVN
eukprot:TRINITY_DN9910_c0_g1_i1.p2 TRINITY_DN9910_c0_g1~~TRINITY_DN9910_c0_g1_i1.p2  ORF type:complete len:1054 (-),score=146.54 TRINITY_DN9910_c0_g1_i1:3491-6652(-)